MSNLERPWDQYIKDLMDLVRWSRWNGKSNKGDEWDAIQSAIKSALRKEECPPIDDPEFYDFLKKQLERKINTYRLAYRNGDGETTRFSQLGTPENPFPIELIASIQKECPDSEMEIPPQSFAGGMSHELVELCMKWVRAEAESFESSQLRSVANLWLDGATIAEIEAALGLTNYQVRMSIHDIKKELQRRAK